MISALRGDAAAGGVPLALAADYVVGREDIVLNPYYQHMGGLYGSEYWTYLLPRRIGAEMTAQPHQPAVHPDRRPPGRTDRAAGRRLRRHAEQLSRPHPRPGRTARTPMPAWRTSWRRRRHRRARRRAHQASARVPQRGAGPVAEVLLRPRPQLPPGAAAVRLQTGPRRGRQSARRRERSAAHARHLYKDQAYPAGLRPK